CARPIHERRLQSISSYKWDHSRRWLCRMLNELGDRANQTVDIRFDDISRGAGVDCALPVCFTCGARKEQNRRGTVESPNSPAQFQSVNLCQPRMEQVSIEMLRSHRRSGLGSAGYGFRPDLLESEQPR